MVYYLITGLCKIDFQLTFIDTCTCMFFGIGHAVLWYIILLLDYAKLIFSLTFIDTCT